MEHRVYHGHHGLTKVHANSTLLREMGLVIEDDAAMKMTPFLVLVMTTKQLLNMMLLIARQENVSMSNAIVI